MPFSEISAVTFSRVNSVNASTKTFEVKFSLTSGTEYSFSSISRYIQSESSDEHQPLEDFCRSKKLSIRNEIGDEGASYRGDDEKRATRPDYIDDQNDSESEDEDFKAAASGSDVAEEFNEDYSSESSGDEDAAPAEEGEEAAEPETSKQSVHSSSKESVQSSSKKRDAPVEKKEKKDKDVPAKKRAKKDPNAPKRGMTSFIYFSQEKRAEVNATNPGLPIGEVAKILGAKWKELTDSDKSPYEEMAARDKARYQKEMETYVPGSAPSSPKAKKTKEVKEKKVVEKTESKKDAPISNEFVNSDDDF